MATQRMTLTIAAQKSSLLSVEPLDSFVDSSTPSSDRSGPGFDTQPVARPPP
jgi:hypothetical protein